MMPNPPTQYPAAVTSQLLPGEQIRYFSFIPMQGGCLSSGGGKSYWLALTDRRLLYNAKVVDEKTKRTTERDGLIPLGKISFIEVTEVKDPTGCLSMGKKLHTLRIGSSGSDVLIPIPTKEKGIEIRRAYAILDEQHGLHKGG